VCFQKPWKANSHFRADAGFAGHDVVKRLTSNPKDFRGSGNRQAERRNAIMTNNLAGMDGFFIGMLLAPCANRNQSVQPQKVPQSI